MSDFSRWDGEEPTRLSVQNDEVKRLFDGATLEAPNAKRKKRTMLIASLVLLGLDTMTAMKIASLRSTLAWLGCGLGALGLLGYVAISRPGEPISNPARGRIDFAATSATAPHVLPSALAQPPVLDPPPAAASAVTAKTLAPRPSSPAAKATRPRIVTPPPSENDAPPKSNAPSELSLVSRAKATLAAGDIASARASLDERDRRFPQGILVEEADALRVDLLARSGDLDGARTLATRFESAHPTSPYLERVRSIARGRSQ